ncbi:MAG: hypothetical protein IKK83_03460 [Clostridia bacterium]|nr:hypothetical protein [Clostridia bacterium]
MNFFKKIFKTDSKTSTKENRSCSANKSADEPEVLLSTINFERLKQEGNSYITTRKVAYKQVRELKDETVERVFEFAYTMAFDEKHRKSRSGGKIERKNGEIFANTFQGKLAECAAVNFFYKYDNTIEIDFDTYDLGIWDKVDLTVCEKEVAVKSTKHFGQLLLLETKDWNEDGEYIPNLGTPNSLYDFIVLVRIQPSCEDIMKAKKLLYKETIEKTELIKLIKQQKWSYDYVGFITNGDLKQVIRNKHIIPQGALLNGKTPMDANNYYVQAGDLRSMESLREFYE